MAENKDKPQVINNIQELNLEIDYDKLEKTIENAIISAELRKEQTERETIKNKKLSKLTTVILYVALGIAFIHLMLIIGFILVSDFDRVPRLFYNMCIFVLCGIYALVVDKTQNTTSALNLISIILAVISLIIAYGSFAGV